MFFEKIYWNIKNNLIRLPTFICPVNFILWSTRSTREYHIKNIQSRILISLARVDMKEIMPHAHPTETRYPGIRW